MGRRRKSCSCSGEGLRRGAWTAEEDMILRAHIKTYGEGRWRSIPEKAGLERCGKSCRLRWLNYLRPDIKRGNITLEEEDLIIRLHKLVGNRWSLIAGRIPGRTDNEIKNYWNTYLKKKVESCRGRSKSSTPARAQPAGCSAPVVSAERKPAIPKPEEAPESARDEACLIAPEEESWWDMLMSLDAGSSGAAAQSSSLGSVSLYGDESPGNSYLEEMMIASAQADFNFELVTAADFFSYLEH